MQEVIFMNNKTSLDSDFPKMTLFKIALRDESFGYNLVASVSGKKLNVLFSSKAEAMQYAVSRLWLIQTI